MLTVNYKDIQYIEMFILNGNKLHILNIYNDSKSFTALCYLEDKALDISEVYVIARDFNLCHHLWNT